jgi:hypothetical protein
MLRYCFCLVCALSCASVPAEGLDISNEVVLVKGERALSGRSGVKGPVLCKTLEVAPRLGPGRALGESRS